MLGPRFTYPKWFDTELYHHVYCTVQRQRIYPNHWKKKTYLDFQCVTLQIITLACRNHSLKTIESSQKTTSLPPGSALLKKFLGSKIWNWHHFLPTFSLTRPSGPGWSKSRHVRLFVWLSVKQIVIVNYGQAVKVFCFFN